MFVYTNVSSGQVVKSETPLARLDGLARWERTEDYGLDARSGHTSSESTPSPRRSGRRKPAGRPSS